MKLECQGMVNSWRCKMHAAPEVHNGGPRPESVDLKLPIGERLHITVTGPESKVRAFMDGMDAGLTCEIWVAKDGKFA